MLTEKPQSAIPINEIMELDVTQHIMYEIIQCMLKEFVL